MSHMPSSYTHQHCSFALAHNHIHMQHHQEMQAKHRFLRPGDRVVDLGAAPGGWSVVTANIIGRGGQLIAVDLLPMDPLPGDNTLVLQVKQRH